MKLATRYQRSHLLATLLLFLLAGIAFYILLHRVLILQVDEDIEIEQHEIESYVRRFGTLPQNMIPVEGQIVRFEKVPRPLRRYIRRTVIMRDEIENQEGAFRQLIFSTRVDGQWYRISVSKSLEATEGLAHLIGVIALGTIALMLLLSFLINRIVLRRLWRPFYDTVEKLRHFQLDSNQKLALPPVKTEEFALLNNTLAAATGKAIADYELLKEFTENASHELQTPLAIIRSKLDLLIQDVALTEKQSSLINEAYTAVGRMAHLNGSLLMLAKIQAGQFDERVRIDIKPLLQEKLALFSGIIQDKNLTVNSSLLAAPLFINPALADILLNNLLANAIHHNVSGGSVNIGLRPDLLAVCNSSAHGHCSLPTCSAVSIKRHRALPGQDLDWRLRSRSVISQAARSVINILMKICTAFPFAGIKPQCCDT